MNHSPQNIVTKVRRRNGKVRITLQFDVEEDKKYFDKEEMAARLKVTTPWMLEHLYSWADFDSHYTIQLFSDALQNLGRGLLRWDNCVSSLKNGRRAIFAGKYLKRAYDYFITEDKSHENHMKRITTTIKDGKKGRLFLFRNYHMDNAMGMDPEEYETKMLKVIDKRVNKAINDHKKSVWEFIHKHIEGWWD